MSLSLTSLPLIDGGDADAEGKSIKFEESFKRLLNPGSEPQTPSQPSGIDRLSVDYPSLSVTDSRTPSETSETSETSTAEVPLDSTSMWEIGPLHSDPRLDTIWETLLEAKFTEDDHDPILMALRQQLVKKPSDQTDSIPNLISTTRLLNLYDHETLRLEEFVGDNIPPYAILSHTWGAEEVTFQDLVNGTANGKRGYKKIQFCGEQARYDGLQYFWVDTCCIDKTNNAELSEAINSMFRLYRNATKCYVYLSDVSTTALDASDKHNQIPWESAFRQSRWFTRGWTLQELLASASVEFFSREGEKLSNKKSLERQIREIIGIPVKALRGSPLSQFSVTERMSWAKTRETTRKEDKAYSLLGIFEVHMPHIYGEGRENAFIRLHEAIEKASKSRL